MSLDYDLILRPSERAELSLRALYQQRGFRRFKISKFEEYDFYSDKKDFLTDTSILSFTDTNGRLMALKPDVTLSIVKNTRDEEGGAERIFYSENVYRAPIPSDGFREIRQTGVECIGDLSDIDILEIVRLAAESLALISDDYRLNISDMGIVSEILERAGLDGLSKKKALSLLSSKNADALKSLIGGDTYETAKLLFLTGTPEEVTAGLKAGGIEAQTLAKLSDIPGLNVDFSVVSDLNYYNGIVMQGFVPGVPEVILSGGEYDPLLRKMGRKARGAGFSVYTDALDRCGEGGSDASILNIALPKGRLGEEVLRAFEDAGFGLSAPDHSDRKLVTEDSLSGIRVFWVKPSDVHIYVERGVADIGVAGKDILLEYEPRVYELMDLDIGKCFVAEAAPALYRDDTERTLRVATKYENIARRYYEDKGRDIDIIRLKGSIELAPILGLADTIVDIVETGKTLRENNLEVTEKIVDISARLIAGKSSYEFKKDLIGKVTDALKDKL